MLSEKEGDGARLLFELIRGQATKLVELTFGVDSVGVFDLRFDSKLSQSDGRPFAEHQIRLLRITTESS